MYLKTLGAVLEAQYYTKWLETSEKTGSKGGVMLVADPESMKSEMLKILEGRYGVSWRDDLNVKTINSQVRPAIARGQISALVFPEFQKLLERRDETAKNTIGHLRSFVHDGIFEGANDNPLAIQEAATCMIFGALTIECFNKHMMEWMGSGFARRVLWVHYRIMEDGKDIIRMAHRLGVRLELFTQVDFQKPVGTLIPVKSTVKERARLDELLGKGVDTLKMPFNLETCRIMYAILNVLKWQEHRGMLSIEKMTAMDIMEDFIPSLGNVVNLEFPDSMRASMERLQRERMAAEDGVIDIKTKKNGTSRKAGR